MTEHAVTFASAGLKLSGAVATLLGVALLAI